MMKKILLAVAAAVAILAVFVALRPSRYAVERSTAVSAPPEVVYAQVADFHRWDAWSPWAKLDPAMRTTFSGAPAGPGAVYEWAGNGEVGKGRMTLTDAAPPSRISIDLQFIEPFASRSRTEFALAPAAGGTRVSWAMTGDLGFVEKAFGLFMDMDAMVAGDFEKGLARLKAAAEAEAARAGAVPAAAR